MSVGDLERPGWFPYSDHCEYVTDSLVSNCPKARPFKFYVGPMLEKN